MCADIPGHFIRSVVERDARVLSCIFRKSAWKAFFCEKIGTAEMRENLSGALRSERDAFYASYNLVHRVRFFFLSAPRTRTLVNPWQEVRKSRTSGSSTHVQKFETTVVVNGYKNGLSLRLRINWKWSESVFLMLSSNLDSRALLLTEGEKSSGEH